MYIFSTYVLFDCCTRFNQSKKFEFKLSSFFPATFGTGPGGTGTGTLFSPSQSAIGFVAQHARIAAQPPKHILSLLCFLLLGCQQSGSSQHGGDRGPCQGTDGGDWARRTAGAERQGGHGESSNLTCGLGWEGASKILMQALFVFYQQPSSASSSSASSSSALEQTVLALREKLHPQHNTQRRWKVASCCIFRSGASMFQNSNTLGCLSEVFPGQYDDKWLFNSTCANTIIPSKAFMGYQGND